MPAYRDAYIGLAYEFEITITLTAATFAAGAAGWTWKVRIDKARQASGTPDVEVEITTKSLSGDLTALTLRQVIPAAEMAKLAPGRNEMEVTSDASTIVLPWPESRGPLTVRRPLGTA